MMNPLFLLCSTLLVSFNGLNAHEILPGMVAGRAGDIAGQSDFVLNLRPPEESTKDIEESLDATMKLEDVKSKVAADDFARQVEAEKVAIRDIVRIAFEPLVAKLQAKGR